MVEFFRKFFKKEQRREAVVMDGGATTAPLTDHQIQSILQNQSPRYEIQQLVAAVGQSVGKQRDHNEDSLLAITATLGGEGGNIPFGLYIVADGMGGHQFGEVASNASIRIVAGQVMRSVNSYLYGLPSQAIQDPLQEIMENAVKEAHRYVQREAPGSGTTVTAALVLGQQVTIAHVGDSRAYSIYPDGRISPITRDHSLVKRLEELGHLSADEAANFPHRNVLIRALGQGEALEADVFTVSFPQPGYLMLCSDGLWSVINDPDIYRNITEAPNLQRACQNLVEAANLAGGPDNISVILVQLIG
ncbi:MAG: PP2C family protein-serine/threonine phosphatase [Chloroflexota bacterium]